MEGMIMIRQKEMIKKILGSNYSAHTLHEHPLIFIEDLKVDGEKEVVCGVCEEPPSGPGYKCSDCNFLRHKSCFELPDEIQHSLHPNHTLFIRAPAGRIRYCDACGKCCRRCFFYWCDRNHCDFVLDTKCASRWQVNKDDCHQHAYVPFLKLNQITFTCEACGEKGTDIGCLCSICQLLIHTNCASLPRTIKIADHDHLLTLTYSVHKVNEHAKILCKLCSKEVNTKYATYYCQKCNYAAHLRCRRWRDLGEDMNAIVESAPTGYIGHVSGLIKDINRAENEKDRPREIKHFSHRHNLILSYEELEDDKLCDGCMQLISPPFYSCAQCNFFLHNICANLPTNARHPLVPSTTFTLLSQEPSSDGVFECVACKQYRHGFTYSFGRRKVIYDIQCFAIQKTLQHECHQHPLFFATTSDQKCKFCELRGVLLCSPRNFALCFRCATLPHAASHKYDEHPLKLTYTAEDNKSSEYYCLICEKERNPKHLFYYCTECDFPVHPQCVIGKYGYIKFGKTYKDEHHQHPFTIVRKTKYSSPCDNCSAQFDGVALECTQCKLTIHPKFGFLQKICLLKQLIRVARVHAQKGGIQAVSDWVSAATISYLQMINHKHRATRDFQAELLS